MGLPKCIDVRNRRRQLAPGVAPRPRVMLLQGGKQVLRLFVGIGCNHIYPKYGIGLLELCRWAEIGAIGFNGLLQIIGGEVRCKSIRQAVIRRQLRAIQTGAKYPDGQL